MPRGVPKDPSTKAMHHFLVAGEIEFHESGETKNQYMNVNAIHISASSKMNAKALGDMQTKLQMHFHSKFCKTHEDIPEITDVAILSITSLGMFTKEEFLDGAVMTPDEAQVKEIKEDGTKAPMEPDAPTLPVAPAVASEPVVTTPVTPVPVESKPEPVVTPVLTVVPNS